MALKKQSVENHGFRAILKKLGLDLLIISTLASNPLVLDYVSKRAFGNFNNSYVSSKTLEQKVEAAEKPVICIYPAEDNITPKPNKYATEYYTQEQLQIIYDAAKKYNIDEALIMAIGRAENSKEYPFGIMPNRKYNRDKAKYKNKFEKNAYWCAATLDKRRKEFEKLSKKSYNEDINEFIKETRKSYAPEKVNNDPNNKNRFWKDNVTKYYDLYNL